MRVMDLEKRYGKKVVFGGESLEVEEGLSIGLVGKNGAGKSTLLRVLCGIEGVQGGRAGFEGKRVSWPIGFGGGVDGRLHIGAQFRFMGRLMGLGEEEIEEELRWVVEQGGLERELRECMAVGTFSSGMRSRFNFFAAMAFDFDVYCFDEVTAVGDGVFKQRSRELMRGLKERGKVVVLTTHNLEDLRGFADAFVLLRSGAGAKGGSRLERYGRLDELLYQYARLS